MMNDAPMQADEGVVDGARDASYDGDTAIDVSVLQRVLRDGLNVNQILQMPESMGRALLWVGVLMLAVALLISIAAFGLSIWAVTEEHATTQVLVTSADAKLSDANFNLHEAWYWLQMDYSQQLANGGHPPALPKRPAALEKKD